MPNKSEELKHCSQVVNSFFLASLLFLTIFQHASFRKWPALHNFSPPDSDSLTSHNIDRSYWIGIHWIEAVEAIKRRHPASVNTNRYRTALVQNATISTERSPARLRNKNCYE
ncbi:hypothetical protein OS493_016349 [Desmophyllum pertusum]|uniref:Uncharacterized protein n=1 Tax=Desmophyllum pertusum TaxID=174260 RepID=A0A9W9ZP39_9CNID|nr:hypothetical protein OS493_016349 [Desmophyllum pertusum]